MTCARKTTTWVATVLLALACCGTVLAAASSHAASRTTLAGKWKGTYGGAVSGHFTIRWRQTGTTLHGTIRLSTPSGRYSSRMRSFGEWMFDSGSAMPLRIVGMP